MYHIIHLIFPTVLLIRKAGNNPPFIDKVSPESKWLAQGRTVQIKVLETNLGLVITKPCTVGCLKGAVSVLEPSRVPCSQRILVMLFLILSLSLYARVFLDILWAFCKEDFGICQLEA